MKYSTAHEVESVTESKKELKFTDLYSEAPDGKTWTFKDGEKPTTVVIDPQVGTYDASK